MSNVITFDFRPRNHACTSAGGRKNVSIETVPPDASLNRLASDSDASLRPAQMLRMCEGEQSQADATSSIVIPFSSIQRRKGCGSDMAAIISAGNTESQAQKFLGEMEPSRGLTVDLFMSDIDTPPIYLGDWLAYFGISYTQAAEIAGCTQGYISNIVANRKENINVLYLLRLSNSLGITINDFYVPAPQPEHTEPIARLSPQAQQAVLSRSRRAAEAKVKGRRLS